MSSQEGQISSHTAFAEKIYLQLNNIAYTSDETIWFKSIVVHTPLHTSTGLSGVLYVELINPAEEIVAKKLIKLTNGIGEGFFELHQNYKAGTYLIRAYTTWNKNFGINFIYTLPIQIYSAFKNTEVDPISNIRIENKEDQSRWLKATIEPLLVDSLYKNNDKLTLFFSIENKKDSLSVKKNKEDRYTFEYPLSENAQFVTLQFRTKNILTTPQTISIDPNYLDFQFFPESGSLVHGIESKVGFKVLGANGKGKPLYGEIVNEKEEFITSFKSNYLGMGSIVLNQVDSTSSYFAKIPSTSEDGLYLKYPLPKIQPMGNVLSITKNDGKIHIHVVSNYIKNDSVSIMVSCRGLNYFEISGLLKENELHYSLKTNELPEGIIAFKLMDSKRVAMAERLFFNERPESRLHIALIPDKKTYGQRELTNLTIQNSNFNGDPIQGSASVLVVNKEHIGSMLDTRQHILSYFLLSSDLKGVIENPRFYFEKDSIRYQDLDNLLLTQGWSKYQYTQPIKEFLFEPEEQLMVKGKVESVAFQKNKKLVELSLMTFGLSKSFMLQTTDSLGGFKFKLEDAYGERLKILIKSTNQSGKERNYKIDLEQPLPPDIVIKPKNVIKSVDSVIYKYIQKNIERRQVEDIFRISTDVNQLDEVVVNAYKMTPARSKVMKEYGKPDVVIDGKAIREKEKKWSYGLFSVLLFSHPDKIRMKLVDGVLRAEVKSNNFETICIVDGIPIDNGAYSLIGSIPPSEVKSVEIIEDAQKFSFLYVDVFNVSLLEAPVHGNVISIYTHTGKGISGANKSIGLLQATVPVFSPIREFYSPNYKNLTASDWVKPDVRPMVYWNPQVVLDEEGKATLSYFNADILGEMKIIVEIISENGTIGYQELIYEIEKVTQ
tara:strand:- start:96408 stop:99071 length:2664 start_codon:yes stop_codon:yes gene_type:complete